MSTDVTLLVVDAHERAGAALDAARAVVERVARTCTRFDADSPLMRANAAGGDWYPLPWECYAAVEAAAAAHETTGGLFDPRILRDLVALGYDRSLPFEQAVVDLGASPSSPGTDPCPTGLPLLTLSPPASAPPRTPRERWQPGLDPAGLRVRIGPDPIDLGGIGKGLAVRWAGEELAFAGAGFLVEAGGDCLVRGVSPDGGAWRVGVENPVCGDQPVAVLQVRDAACATSSVRRRTWRVGGRQVHHLLDPRTGRSADGGLLSVSVVGDDPAQAEVWSKSLLVVGRREVAGLAAAHGLAALWVDADGRSGCSDPMRPLLLWTDRDVD